MPANVRGAEQARADRWLDTTAATTDSWKQYELDGDGKITPREFMAVRAICFAKYDANSDGLLTRPEVKKFFSSPLGIVRRRILPGRSTRMA